jgi:hypothetical protein
VESNASFREIDQISSAVDCKFTRSRVSVGISEFLQTPFQVKRLMSATIIGEGAVALSDSQGVGGGTTTLMGVLRAAGTSLFFVVSL